MCAGTASTVIARLVVSLSDAEKISLLRAALNTLRPQLPTLPQRQHVDELLRLTDDGELNRLFRPAVQGR